MNLESTKIQISHGLLNGLPLCRFSLEFPVNWPADHCWVPSWEVDEITCVRCKSEAEMISATNFGT